MSGRSDEAPAPQDDPISPSSFVEHIRELGEKRDREDQERNRLLEEQILQGRAERAARRAERQRSLSPEKSSQASTPRSAANTPPRSLHPDPDDHSELPASMDAHGDALQRLTGAAPEAQGDETATPAKASPAAPFTPTRSNTLSWQQRRPNSPSGRRPLSQIAAENSASRSPNATPEPSAPADDTASRAQIAQSLGSKDPEWFKQTPDRAIGSAPLRRSQEDDGAEAASIPEKRQLPGLSRDTAAEGPSSPPAESVRSSSPSRASSARGSAAFSNRFSRDTSVSGYSASDMKSPLPTLDSQRFRPPTSEHDDTEHGPSERSVAMSPAQQRVSPERTPSPTKGMGGFVQSAMMRRSDSVNKRWSVQTGGGLSRHNSTASIGGVGGASTPKLDARPTSRDETSERPTSSHSNATEKPEGGEEAIPTRPSLSLRHSRGKSVSSITQLEENRSGAASPSSPSKRWSRSPTKSSWLESALSAKPESPKPQAPAQQPSWMAEISKIKAQKASVDLSKTDKPSTDAPATPTSPTKFPRGDALHGSESRGSAQGDVAQSPDLGQGPPEKITDREQHPAPESAGHIASTPKSKPATLSSPKMETAKDSSASPTLESPAAKAEKPAVGVKSPGLRGATPPASKSEDPPKPDFRTTLKHRQRQSESVKKEELEFQNVFGKLKKTHTEKFVAPDTLKDNILRGKTGLNQTGGPAPRVKKDEFRESLVKQRESIKLKADEHGGSHVRTGSLAKPADPVAEALEKRKQLGRKESVAKIPSPPAKDEPSAADTTESKETTEPKEPVESKEAPDSKETTEPKEPVESKEAPDSKEAPEPTGAPEIPAKHVGRSESHFKAPPSPAKEEPPAAEALTKLKSLRERKLTESSKPETTEKSEAPAKPAVKVPGKLSDRFNAFPDPARPTEKVGLPARPNLKPVGKLADRFPAAAGSAKPTSPKETDAPSPSKLSNKVPGKLADRFNAPSEPIKPASSEKESEPAGKLSNRASGKLADRFNPALAAMLARGPGGGAGASGPGSASPASSSVEPATGSTKELTHITKGRARGPKRRAPKGKSEAATSPEPTTETASPKPARKASVVANISLVKNKDVLPSSPTAPDTQDEKAAEPKSASPPPESKPKPVAPAKSPEVTRRVSAKLDSPSEPAVPAKSPELSRRISAKFEQPSTPPEPAIKSPDLAKRISAKFEQRKSPPPEPSTPKPSELSKKASGKFDSHQSTMELDLSAAAKADSPKKTESPTKVVSPVKAASPTKVESPTEPGSSFEAEISTKPASPTKVESPTKPASPFKSETPSKPESPTKTDVPAKSDAGAKSDIAKRIAALKQGGDQPASSQPGAPKPLFAGGSRLNKDTKSPTSPSTPSPTTPTVETPKPQKPLPQAPASEEEKPPTPAKDKPEAGSSPVKSAAAMWTRQKEPTSSPGTPRAKSPIKLPTKKDEQEAMENAGLVRSDSPKVPIGLGIASLNDNKENRSPSPRISKELPAPPTKTPLSPPTTAGATPPKPAKKPESISSPKISQEDPSPIPQQSEAGQLFADFFDDAPVTSGKLDVDAHATLTGSPLSTDRIKTVRKEIQEISGDGKLSPVPGQEEHILFDNSMYLCTHVFASSNGTKNTEVYLWTGVSVPEPTIEDAQLFARKAARDVGGKLLIVRQGKESPNFFQALGGILVTRKGTRTDHSKQYMLCGRQHLGHMAFDEVELSLNSLCSGFPYLISSRTGLLSGKIFLWKGKGCSAEELGCARLIGMDLGLTPEIEEIDEGKEPASFLDIFPAPDNGKEKRVPRSAEHWRLKANHDKYSVRLFRIDEKAVQSGGSFQNNSGPAASGGPKPNMTAEVVEVAPFSQMDIEAENIYVLDAFFEIYIVVGALSRSQSHAFSTALLFAQEYGILAASLQDRPFIPVSTVVLEGVPRDMKAVFRRWEDQMQPTAALMSGKPRRGKSLRIVGLQAAIAATRENGAAT